MDEEVSKAVRAIRQSGKEAELTKALVLLLSVEELTSLHSALVERLFALTEPRMATSLESHLRTKVSNTWGDLVRARVLPAPTTKCVYADCTTPADSNTSICHIHAANHAAFVR